MCVIACAQALWSVARHWEEAKRTPQAEAPGGLLGGWSATRFRDGELDLVLALNDRTYLTVVLPVNATAPFADRFREAVTAALEDLNVPAAVIRREAPSLGVPSLVLLRNAQMRAALAQAKQYCDLDSMYVTDLRRLQRNLNEAPYPGIPGCAPEAAVADLLGRGTRAAARD